eukprot:CAMPEP_0179026120 /NCGR_PEP_ID=MMETSP0796-20121207/8349_1 /TAXON_ID=73915 /ORGANISM="Pyrodinium bahamense, Strain pbaha01" /LENGTH=44 /DNA_ID= /DNA_START= /DNA_END= /DNA_ORIENTATION=
MSPADCGSTNDNTAVNPAANGDGAFARKEMERTLLSRITGCHRH